MSVTNAERFLKQKKIPYEAREYDFKVKGAEYAAEALDWPPEAMIKTLVVALSDGSFCLCLLPAGQELSLKNLAREAGLKSARMTTPEEAEKLTGYRVGGISPFGTRKPLPAWLHAPLLGFERVGINGGHRGLIVFLDPKAIRDSLGARVAELAA
jgi:Cys-tRNA(Pro)/Cys-tRNA(Cys) deacylase